MLAATLIFYYLLQYLLHIFSNYLSPLFIVPLVSRILPSDICKIHKRGSCIRLDSTLVDFNDMRWERGDVSFLFIGHVKPSEALTVLDNKECLYQRVRYEVCTHFVNVPSCFFFLFLVFYFNTEIVKISIFVLINK